MEFGALYVLPVAFGCALRGDGAAGVALGLVPLLGAAPAFALHFVVRDDVREHVWRKGSVHRDRRLAIVSRDARRLIFHRGPRRVRVYPVA